MTNTKSLTKAFKSDKWLNLALTHRSWINENATETESNERLEFLGDAILEFIVSRELFNRFPKKEEGYLTALRANLVNTVNLAIVAKKIGIGKKLKLSKGEEEGGGRENPSLLANTVEAIIGALFMDGGLRSAEKFIQENLISDLDKIVAKPLKDAKSQLQEYIQAKGLPAPRYEVEKETGPDHAKTFTISVMVDKKVLARGKGKNKGTAEQSAAQKALAKDKTA